jgi:hypothetical protein
VSRPDELVAAAQLLDLDPAGARLVSASSRLIWHLPVPDVALTISRPGAKSRADVTAETNAMRAAEAAGVRTPRLRAGPVGVGGDCWAFATEWITGRRPNSADWPAIAAAAAKLADAPTANLRPFIWPDGLEDPRIGDVLGHELHADLLSRSALAARAFGELMATAPPVLAHTDLQPANALCNDAGAWLLDLEYAALTPREWDPAKLVILARRFGDPLYVDELLDEWAGLDRDRLHRSIDAQEALLVAWLARMAARGTAGAASEVRHRAENLDRRRARWHHLT